MQEINLSDNKGNRVAPDGGMLCPVAASGQSVATGTAGDDLTFTVEGGFNYVLTGIGTSVLASLTGVTSTAANVEYAMGPGLPFVIIVPDGVTTIYLEGDTGSKNIHLRRLAY